MLRSRPLTALLAVALFLVLVLLGQRLGDTLGIPGGFGTLLLAFVVGTVVGSIGVIRASRSGRRR
jgi:hypothetical protein